MNNPSDIVISCRKVRKVYSDGSRELVVLNGVNMDVPAGKLLTITGPSGVGKSTLLHIMGTLDKPSSGDVFFRGENLRTLGNGRINYIRNRRSGSSSSSITSCPNLPPLKMS